MWTVRLMAVLLLQESLWSDSCVDINGLFCCSCSCQDQKLQPDHPSGVSQKLLNNRSQLCFVKKICVL